MVGLGVRRTVRLTVGAQADGSGRGDSLERECVAVGSGCVEYEWVHFPAPAGEETNWPLRCGGYRAQMRPLKGAARKRTLALRPSQPSESGLYACFVGNEIADVLTQMVCLVVTADGHLDSVSVLPS